MFPETDFTLLGSQPAILRALTPPRSKLAYPRTGELLRDSKGLQLISKPKDI
jgi:hypothetical protein